MQVRVGSDLVYMPRFKNILGKIQDRAFSPSEMKNLEVKHLAGLFAAKEAVIKALNLKAGSWLSIEIGSKKSGKPLVKLAQSLGKNKAVNYDLSISHDGKYALAVFVALVK